MSRKKEASMEKDSGRKAPARLYTPSVRQITPPEKSKNPGRTADVLMVVGLGLLVAGIVGWLATASGTLFLLGLLLGSFPLFLSAGYRKEYRQRQKAKNQTGTGKAKGKK